MSFTQRPSRIVDQAFGKDDFTTWSDNLKSIRTVYDAEHLASSGSHNPWEMDFMGAKAFALIQGQGATNPVLVANGSWNASSVVRLSVGQYYVYWGNVFNSDAYCLLCRMDAQAYYTTVKPHAGYAHLIVRTRAADALFEITATEYVTIVGFEIPIIRG